MDSSHAHTFLFDALRISVGSIYRASGFQQGSLTNTADLSKLKHLEHLDLSFNSSRADDLADRILESVSGVNSLRGIQLHESGVTDAGMEHLKSLTQLTSLSVYQEARLSDDSLTSIATLKGLKSLSLPSCVGTNLGRMQFSEAAMQSLSGLQELKSFGVAGHDLSPELISFPKLEYLDASRHCHLVSLRATESLQNTEK